MAKQLNIDLQFTANTSQAKQSIYQLQSSLNQIAAMGNIGIGGEKISAELKQAGMAAQELQVHLSKAFNTETGKLDLNKLNNSLLSSKTSLSSLSSQIMAIGPAGTQAFTQLATAVSQANVPAVTLNATFGRLWSTMKNTARWQLSSSMLHGFVGAISEAYQYAQDLNESLNNIRIVTGYSAESMEEFAKKANQAAKALSATTLDYTEAALIYYQQGLGKKEVEERANVTVKLANVSRQTTEVASDQLTAIWNNFDDGTKALEYYADVLTALGAATASSTDEIAGGLEKFAAIGETIGLSYEYAAAALATITSNTRQTEEVVGTALKTIFARIQGLKLGETLDDGTSLNKYSQALQTVGISIFEQSGELKKMDNILSELGSRWEQLSKSQQTALAQTVAGIRQYTQFIALMDNWNDGTADSMQANLQTAYGSEGALQEQADIYAESWEAARDRVTASAQAIYSALLDDDFFIGLSNFFSDVLDSINKFVDGIGGIKGVIGVAITFITSALASRLNPIIDSIRANFQVMFTSASAQANKLSNEMRNLIQVSQEQTGIQASASQFTVLDNANQLIVAKTKLSSVTKNLSSQERLLAEMNISLIETEQEKALSIAETIDKLREEQATIKEQMMSGQTQADMTTRMMSPVDKRFGQLEEQKIQAVASGDTSQITAINSQLNALNQQYGNIEFSANAAAKAILSSFITNLEQGNTEVVSGSAVLKEYIINMRDFANNNVSKMTSTESLQNARMIITEYISTLPEAVTKTNEFQTALSSLGRAKTGDTTKKAILAMVDAMDKAKFSTQDLRKMLIQLGQGNNIKKIEANIQNLNKEEKKLLATQERINQAIKNFNPTHAFTKVEKITAFGSALMSVSMIYNSLKSAISAWKDPDMSFGEQLMTTFMSLGMIIPMVTSGFSNILKMLGLMNAAEMKQIATMTLAIITNRTEVAGLKAKEVQEYRNYIAKRLSEGATKAQIAAELKSQNASLTSATILELLTAKKGKEAAMTALQTAADNGNVLAKAGVWAITKLQAIAEGALTAGKTGSTVATIAQTAANWALNASMGPLLVVIIAIVAALALLVAGVIGFVAAIKFFQSNSPEGKLKALEERAQKSEEAFNRVSEAVKATQEAIEGLKEGYQTIEKLTKGTEEWYEEITKANAEVLKLISKFPELQELGYVFQQDGLMKITDEGFDYVEQRESQRLQAANNIKVKDKIAVMEQQRENSFSNYKQADGYTISTALAEAIQNAYEHEQIGETLFTEQGSKALLDTLQEAGYFTYKTAEEFHQIVMENQELIRKNAARNDNIQMVNDTKTMGYMATFGSNRTLEQTNELLGENVYQNIYDSKLEDIKGDVTTKKDGSVVGFGNWNDHINYSKDDKEWAQIQDFMSTQGDDVKYVAQRHGKMVLEIDGEEIEYTKDEVYEALAELYSGPELEAQLTEKLQETLGKSLGDVDLSDASLTDLTALDNFRNSIAESLAGTEAEGQTDNAFKQIISSYGTGEEGINAFKLDTEFVNTGGADFQNNIQALAQGKITVEEFTTALREMNAEGQIDSMGEFFKQAAEGMGLSAEDATSMQQYAKHLMAVSEESDMLSDSLKENAEGAADLAVEITRMNKGVDTLADNFDDWKDILKKSSKESAEYAKAMGGMKKALSDVLDVEEDLISSDFVDKHMDEIEKAATGDADAIDFLRSQMDEEIIQQVILTSPEEMQEAITNLDNKLKSELERINSEIPDIEVGAILQDQAFLDAANNLVTKSGMTADEANAYFAGIGYEPVYNTTDIDNSAETPNSSTRTYVEKIDWEEADVDLGVFGEHTISLPAVTTKTESVASKPTSAEGVMRLTSFSGEEKPPEIKGMRKKATGSQNNYSSTNSGGGSPGTSSKKSGGSKKKEKPKTLDKTEHKKKDDEIERYSEITEVIDDLTRAYDEAGAAKDDLWGPDKLQAMEAEGKALGDLITAHKKYQKEIAEYDENGNLIGGNLKKDKDAAVAVGATFDKNGRINNYDELMDTAVDTWNNNTDSLDARAQALENERARIANMEDGAAKDAAEEKYDADMNKLEKDREANDKVFEDTKEALSTYTDTLNLSEEAAAQLQDYIRQMQQIEYEKTMYKVEFQVEINERALKVIEHKLKRLEDDFFKSAEAMAMIQSKADYYDQDQYQRIADGVDELETKFKAGEITQAQYIEGLGQFQDMAMDNIDALYEMNDAMKAYYSDTLDAGMQKIQDMTQHFDNLVSRLQHYQSILNLMGHEQNYDLQNKLLQGQIDTLNDRIDVSKSTIEMLDGQLKQAQANYANATTEEEKQQWQQRIMDINNALMEEEDAYLSYVEQVGEAANQILTNEIEKAFKEVEDQMTGNMGFDSILNDMERMNTLTDEYLTNTNKMYETNKLIAGAQQAIDKTTNLQAKQQYQHYIEYIEQLQTAGNLTQTELEVAQARYKVLEAEMALEEAKEAKSTVRLSRDAEGNFGYVYTADQGNVDSAQQNYLDAQNELYNIGLETTNEYREKIIDLQQQTLEDLKQLEIDYRVNHLISEEEYEQQKAAIMETSQETLKTYQEQFNLGQFTMATTSYSALMQEDINFQNGQLSSNKEHYSLMESNDSEYYNGIKTTAETTQDTLEKNLAKFNVGVLSAEDAQYFAMADKDTKYYTGLKELCSGIAADVNGIFNTNEDSLSYQLTETFYNNLNGALDDCKTATEKWQENMSPLVEAVGVDFDGNETEEGLSQKIANTKKQSELLNDYMTKKPGGLIDSIGKELTEVASATLAWEAHWKTLETVIGYYDTLIGKIQTTITEMGKMPDTEGDTTPPADPTPPANPTSPTNNNTDNNNTNNNQVGNDLENASVNVQKGVAYAVWNGAWGNGNARKNLLNQKFGEGAYETYQALVNQYDIATKAKGTGWIKELGWSVSDPDVINKLTDTYGPSAFLTGGYTGEWGPEGKLAMLHEKELVLNKQDTENFLTATSVLREISHLLDNNALIASLGAINLAAMTINSQADKVLQQEVTIHAEFPNVSDHSEIELAIDNLINAASQHAFKS